MPEPAAWKYQKITKPMFDTPAPERVLLGRVLTAVGDEIIEDGFVHIKDGHIAATGPRAEAPASVQHIVGVLSSAVRGDMLLGVTFDPHLL